MTSGYLSAHTEPWAGSEREQGVVPGQPGPHKPLSQVGSPRSPTQGRPQFLRSQGPRAVNSSPVLPSTLRLSSPICKMGRTGWSEGVSETEGSGSGARKLRAWAQSPPSLAVGDSQWCRAATLGTGPGRVGAIAPKQALSSVVLGTSRGQARGRRLKRSQGARVAEGLCPTRLGCLPREAEEAPRGQALTLQPQCPLSEGGSWDSPNALGVKRRCLRPFCRVPTSATSWPYKWGFSP